MPSVARDRGEQQRGDDGRGRARRCMAVTVPARSAGADMARSDWCGWSRVPAVARSPRLARARQGRVSQAATQPTRPLGFRTLSQARS